MSTQRMDVCFLGTSSGGGPVESRNCSSLALDITGDGNLWLVDCAEGTVRQFAINATRINQSGERAWKIGKVTKIFITHMHADHIMGIPTMLRNTLGFPHPHVDSSIRRTPTVEIYGPPGLRTLIRTVLSLTHTRSAEKYCVHELLTPSDHITSCAPEVLHSNELPGRDVMCDIDGFWRNLEFERTARAEITVHAGPIEHRDPCIGYVFHEPATLPHLPQPRKVVVLGDCSSATSLTPLIASTPGRVSLLIHEATDAFIPANVDAQAARKRTPEVVKAKTEERGHSTPEQAGAVAGMWGAERLVLNHIGARFPAPSKAHPQGTNYRTRIMEEIERQATRAWHSTPYILDSILPAAASNAAEVLQPGYTASSPLPNTSLSPPRGARAIAAYDFMTVSISLVQLSSSSMNAAAASDYEMFAGGSPRGGTSSAPPAGNGTNKRARDVREDSRERRYERMVTEGRYGSGFGYGYEGGSSRGSGGGGGRYDRSGDRERGGGGYRGYGRG